MKDKMHIFYAMLITQAISILGSAMAAFAVAVWVYQQTGDATPLALAATFAVLPAIFTTGFAGIAVDRFDRKTLIIISDAGQALATALLLISISTGSFQLWHLYAVAAIESIFASMQFTTYTASITMLVPEEQRERANTLAQLTGPVSGILAPVIGALLFAAFGVEGTLIIDLITFSIAMIAISRLPIPSPEQESDPDEENLSIMGKMVVGFKLLSQTRPMLMLVIWAIIINYPMRVVMILNTPYIYERVDDEVRLGVITGIMSLGMVIGGIVYSIRGGFKRRMNTVIFATFVIGFFVILQGMSRTGLLIGITGFFAYLVVSAIDAPLFTILQQKVPPKKQGRVFSAVFQSAMVIRPLAFVSAGFFADQIFEPAVGTAGWSIVEPFVGSEAGAGMGLITAMGGLFIALMAVAMYFTPQLRNIEDLVPDYVDPAEPSPDDVDASADSSIPATDTPALPVGEAQLSNS